MSLRLPLLLLSMSLGAGFKPFSSWKPFAAAAASKALPDFLPSSCEQLTEPEARRTLSELERVPIDVGGVVVPTAFWPSAARRAKWADELNLVKRLKAQSSGSRFVKRQPRATKAPRVLLLHGADASSLEWRFLAPKLNALGVSTVAVDWWSGGWTDRAQLLEHVDAKAGRGGPKEGSAPWDVVQSHLEAFWREELNGEPVIVVGASLGGAVALDFAASNPSAVAGLVLVDAGGESYKSPDPDMVSAMAPVALGVKKALAFFTNRAAVGPGKDETLRINSLHRSEHNWSEALGAYLASGGYERRVGRELIQSVRAPTLVVWGEDDPILPVSDAEAFERDLPHCVGVNLVPGAGHTPQIDDPDSVAVCVAQFALELAGRR